MPCKYIDNCEYILRKRDYTCNSPDKKMQEVCPLYKEIEQKIGIIKKEDNITPEFIDDLF